MMISESVFCKLRPLSWQQLLVCCAFILSCIDVYAQNLLANPGFWVDLENAPSDIKRQVPHSWNYDGWNLANTRSFFTIEPEAQKNDIKNLHIHHDLPGHSYLWQSFELKENSTYHFSAKVKVLNADNSNIAAALGVVGQRISANSKSSIKSWHTLNYYINNAEKAKTVNLMLSFGFYSSLNKGKVIFKDVSIKKLSSMPKRLDSGSVSLVYGTPKYEIPNYYLIPPKNAKRFLLLLTLIFMLVTLTFVYYFCGFKGKDKKVNGCE